MSAHPSRPEGPSSFSASLSGVEPTAPVAGAAAGAALPPARLDRRRFMAYFSAAGLGGTLFPGVLWGKAQGREVTKEMVKDAEAIADLDLTDEEIEMMLDGLNRNRQAYDAIHAVTLANAVAPAVHFDVRPPGTEVATGPDVVRPAAPGKLRRPANLEEVAFWPVTHLAELVRTKQVTSTELTKMYLGRLKKHGDRLQAVITLTEERALRQAAQADAEIAKGRYRGPLHGIPWGGKDLLDVKGYRTTYGAKPYENQTLDDDATVVQRLDAAGAVLVAKLTLGALAMGDVWFGGKTRNPWDLEQGSSGSSAGPAAATVAGLVGFSIGTETLGSIVSPSTRCGASGLRPTFGRVPRTGAMALSWSMDKIGPICRAAEDCALVLRAIKGPDGQDLTVYDAPLRYDASVKPADLRIGYYKSAFEGDYPNREFDQKALDVLRDLGARLIPFELPTTYPLGALRIILNAEAAAAFDELTRSGRDDLLVSQDKNSWPNSFRTARFIPAVEYLEANRIRTLIMKELHEAMDPIDVFVSPSFRGSTLLMTNLTGQPTAVVPSGFTDKGTPVSISFVGKLWGEGAAVELARAYQAATDFNTRVPPLFAV